MESMGKLRGADKDGCSVWKRIKTVQGCSRLISHGKLRLVLDVVVTPWEVE